MEQNVCGADKALRSAVGTGLLAGAVFSHLPSRWRIGLGTFSLIPFATALSGYCPLNKLLGINTCRLPSHSH